MSISSALTQQSHIPLENIRVSKVIFGLLQYDVDRGSINCTTARVYTIQQCQYLYTKCYDTIQYNSVDWKAVYISAL